MTVGTFFSSARVRTNGHFSGRADPARRRSGAPPGHRGGRGARSRCARPGGFEALVRCRSRPARVGRNAPEIRAIWLPRPGGIATQAPGIVHPAAPIERRRPPPGSRGVRLVDRAVADPLRAARRAPGRTAVTARRAEPGRRDEGSDCPPETNPVERGRRVPTRRPEGVAKQGAWTGSAGRPESVHAIRREPGRTEHLSRTKPHPSREPHPIRMTCT